MQNVAFIFIGAGHTGSGYLDAASLFYCQRTTSMVISNASEILAYGTGVVLE